MYVDPELLRRVDNAIRFDLESWRLMFFHWLIGSSILVAVGVGFEGPEVVHEVRNIWRTTRREASAWIKIVGLLGWALVVLGVAGEGIFELGFSVSDGQLQTFDEILLIAAQREAGDAARSAITAQHEADAVSEQADAISIRLEIDSEQLDKTEERVTTQGPRWRILDDHRAEIVAALKPYAGQKVIVMSCGTTLSMEASDTLAKFRDIFSYEDEADWKMTQGVLQKCGSPSTYAFGDDGIVVLTSTLAGKSTKDAAKALYGVLFKLNISNIHFEADTSPQETGFAASMLGPDSFWWVAFKNPTAVIFLLGENPMLDIKSLPKSNPAKQAK